MGMTDSQFKAVLLDELEDWQELLRLLRDGKAEEAVEKAQRQIEKTNAKLQL